MCTPNIGSLTKKATMIQREVAPAIPVPPREDSVWCKKVTPLLLPLKIVSNRGIDDENV